MERSEDGATFKRVAEVKATGNTQTVSKYKFNDKASFSSDVYYRIRAVDLDGKYSHRIIVIVNSLAKNELEVYPTLATIL